jgi:hypothetical protein
VRTHDVPLSKLAGLPFVFCVTYPFGVAAEGAPLPTWSRTSASSSSTTTPRTFDMVLLGGIDMKTREWISVAVCVWLMFFAILLAGPVAAGGPPVQPPGLDQAIAAQEAHTDALLAKPGVVGTAVGLGADGRPVVKIYTETARVRGLPAHLDGVPVDVEVTGELVAQADLFARPAPLGVSSGTERLIIYRGHLYCTTGTLGARVTDGTFVYALSNAHVYAGEGSQTSGTVQVWSCPGSVDGELLSRSSLHPLPRGC